MLASVDGSGVKWKPGSMVGSQGLCDGLLLFLSGLLFCYKLLDIERGIFEGV